MSSLKKYTFGIPERDRDFFILLRAGLWRKTDEVLSTNPDWEYIFKLASVQNVPGIITEGISLMNVSGIPPSIFNKFVIARANIVKRNIKVNDVQVRLCQVLDDNGIPYVILKGQGVGRSYPHPEIRCSGDIDFLTGDENFHKVISIFSGYTSRSQVHSEKFRHHKVTIDGVLVEVHGMAKSHFTDRLDKVLENERRKMFSEMSFEHYQHNGHTVSIPNHEYTALFLFGHILRHLTAQGIALKQLCDWMMYIKTNGSRIEVAKFRQLLTDARITNIWKRFSAFAVEWLGYEPDGIIPYDSGCSKYGIAIWRPIKEVREERDKSNQTRFSNYWLILIDSYAVFIARQKYLWHISKRDYVQKIYDKFSPLPPTFVKKMLGIGGDKFHKDRFKS